MKRILFICFAFAAFGLMSATEGKSVTGSVASKAEFSHIKIRIKNDCGHDVKYEYNGLHGSLSKNYYREITIQPGHTLIIDGKDFAEITSSSDGKTYVVCS